MTATGLPASGGEDRNEDTTGRYATPPCFFTYWNHLWDRDLEHSFSAQEINLITRLLKRANQLRKARFHLALDKLMAELGLKTKGPLETARRRLRAAGLLEYRNGNGRGCTTEYHLLGLDFGEKRDKQNYSLFAPLSDTLFAQFPPSFREEKALLHKSKNKKESSTAVRHDEKDRLQPVAAPDRAPTPLAPEPWRAWLQANAPRVQQLKSPLTAEHWIRLTQDFGEELLQDVLLQMENHADLLKKYTSANLTARDWCKRHARSVPVRPTGLLPAPSPTTEDLNPEVARQREAEAARRRAEHLQRQTDPTPPLPHAA